MCARLLREKEKLNRRKKKTFETQRTENSFVVKKEKKFCDRKDKKSIRIEENIALVQNSLENWV
jgi:hypothetical protein